MQFLTPFEAAKLKRMIRQAEEETTKVIREGFESGASQDGHHDEGYQLSKRQSAVSDKRLAELRSVLSDAKIVTPVLQDFEIRLGNIVELLIDGARRHITMCGYASVYEEAEVVSVSSPLGRALLGKKVGDCFEAQLPRGTVDVEILGIQSPSIIDSLSENS